MKTCDHCHRTCEHDTLPPSGVRVQALTICGHCGWATPTEPLEERP